MTRCSNNFGPYQFPEKLVPLMIANAMEDKPLPVYGDGLHVRDWIYVMDHCAAIDTVLEKGKTGEVYNIGGMYDVPNLEIVRTILKQLDKPESVRIRRGSCVCGRDESGWGRCGFDGALHYGRGAAIG